MSGGAGGAETRGGEEGGGALAGDDWQASCGASSPALDLLEQEEYISFVLWVGYHRWLSPLCSVFSLGCFFLIDNIDLKHQFGILNAFLMILWVGSFSCNYVHISVFNKITSQNCNQIIDSLQQSRA